MEKGEKMKAAVFHGPGDIRIEEIDYPSPGNKGMVMKVHACGICPLVDVPHFKSDFPHIDIPPRYSDKWPVGPTSIVLGHEFSGEVVETGSEVTAMKPGDRAYGVIWNPCGACENCRAGKPEECKFVDAAGRAVNGAMAEYILFPNVVVPDIAQDKLIRLPENISYQEGALLEPLILGIGIANKAKPGDVVVVFGQEVMGLGSVARLKEIGVSKIIAGDTSAQKLKLSKKAGADITVDLAKEDIIKVVMDETDGYGADIALEMSCRPESLQEAVSVVKPFGQIWMGTFYTAGPFYNPSYQAKGSISMNITQKPGLSINTAWGTLGPWKPRLGKAVEFLTSGKISSAEVISHVFPLDNAVEAFETASDFQNSIKVMLTP